MDFDIFTGLICVLIALSSGFVIYGISKLTMKGYSSYDDVMASRRQEKSRPASTDRSSEAKKLKKIKKKLKKESLSSSAGTTTPSDDNTPPDEEIIIAQPQDEIIETLPIVNIIPKVDEKPVPSATTSKFKNKPKAPKKTEESIVEVVEITSKKIAEVASEAKIENEPSPKHDSKTTFEVAAQIEYDACNSVDEESSSNDNGKTKKKMKKKKENSVEETGKLTLQSLLPLLKQAEFSHGEVQILIDALLNKDDSEWLKGKQDPMLKLKKQVMEMEKLHADDTETINGLQVKLATLRSELNSEKSHNKTFRETLAKANCDIQAISVKFQQLSQEKESLHMNIQQLKQQLNEEHIIVQRLQEEKLLISQMNVPHEQHHETVVALQSQVNQLAAQLNEEQSMNATLGAQIEDSMRLEEEYRQVSALNVELNHLLSSSQFEVNRLNTELSKANHETRKYQKMADTLEHNLEENKKNGNIGFCSDHSECQALLNEKEKVLKDIAVEMNQKEMAVDKLKNEMFAFRNETNKKQVLFDSLNKEVIALKATNASMTSELNDERNIIVLLRNKIAEKTDAISVLTKDLNIHKHRNNELRSKNWKVVEALEQAEASLKELTVRLNNSPSVGEEAVIEHFKHRISRIVEPFILTTNFGNISDIKDINVWFSKFEDLITIINNEPKTDQLLAQNAKLQSLNTHYRSVINDLEKMLLNLELKIATANKNLKASSNSYQEGDDEEE